MPITQLSDATISRIAAGEVVERPASAVKELLENSIDAGATSIKITIHEGGRNLIHIQDNGNGIAQEELELALTRHATSKLNEEDLFDIAHLGFRGEGLAAIASISRVSLTSTTKDQPHAYRIDAEGGVITDKKPANLQEGTIIEVRDLFYAVPVRLKFLKSERTETQQIQKMVQKIALAYPQIHFCLKDDKKNLFEVAKATHSEIRLRDILGKNVMENMIPIDASHEGMHVKGYISLPTLSKGSRQQQWFFINGRAIQDAMLLSVIKTTYHDYLAPDKHPIIVLYIDIPHDRVDVNVHPMKHEVRFKQPQELRSLISGAITHALHQSAHQTSTTIADEAVARFTHRSSMKSPALTNSAQGSHGFQSSPSSSAIATIARPHYRNNTPSQMPFAEMEATPHPQAIQDEPVESLEEQIEHYPLGAAMAQLHQTYIVAQNKKGIVIVDQHAVHERIVYEQLKKDYQTHISSQSLLIPEIIECGAEDKDIAIAAIASLKKSGFTIEGFGENAIIVRAIPAILGDIDVKSLMEAIIDDLKTHQTALSLDAAVEHILSTTACHGSIRSGRVMHQSEMNELLRQMENTPFSGQCNHGRPTYVELDLKDIETLFGRR